MSSQKVVTRFAPSPTGYMHVGGVRTALYGWLFARKHKGTFILRIEDTDKEREVAGSMEHIIESLKWLGIEWNEGPDIGGPHAPYIQSQRLDSYRKYAQQLIDKGFAYPDPYSKEELEAFRQKATDEKRAFLFRDHRPETPMTWDGTRPLRFKVPEIKKYEWHDAVRGDLSAGPESLDDFILIKSDGYPTYNFAHIIDDYHMGVTHIFRGEEFISSTPRFLSLYDALGFEYPVFVSMPPILRDDRTKKLGKRDGAKDVLDYSKEGYLPEVMFNFLALIGWNPGTEKEIFSMPELIQAFDLNQIQKSGGTFNEDKLDWMNREYLKMMSYEEKEEYVLKYLPEYIRRLVENDKELLSTIISILMERISNGKDIVDVFRKKEFSMTNLMTNTGFDSYVEIQKNQTKINNTDMIPTITTEIIPATNDYLSQFKDPVIDDYSWLIPKELEDDRTKNEVILRIFKSIKEIINNSDWDRVILKEEDAPLWSYASLNGKGKILLPLRKALSGEEKSVDVFEIMKSIGKKSSVRRVDNAINLINTKKEGSETVKSNNKSEISFSKKTFTENHTEGTNNFTNYK